MLLLLSFSASWTGAKAQHYWESKTGNGAKLGDIYYYLEEIEDEHENIIRTAIVTNKIMAMAGTDAGSNSYTGAIVIPEEVISDGKTYTVVGIQDFAFYGSTGLISVDIPKTITSIGKQVFDRCTSLKDISVSPQSSYFFASDGVLLNKLQTELIFCTKTKADKYIVPSSVTKIHGFAFYGCKDITEIVLPNTLKRIEEGAFMNCTGLTKINIPTSLTVLGSNAFRNASSLASSINIPATVSAIASSAFQDCKKLTNVTLPEGMTSIGDDAFNGCALITTIELPASLTTIGISAFKNTGLTGITIPNSITEISPSAFSGCKLTSINLPEGLTKIQTQAFGNNGTTVESVSIPKSVTSIANNAFSGTNVKNFYIHNIPSNLSIGQYTSFNTSTTIHVFDKTIPYFENATNWSKYKGHFVDDIAIVHVSSITLDNQKLTLLTNTLGQLNATIDPDNAEVQDVIYTSSNEDIVLITNSATGSFVTSSIEGTATITCTALDGSDKSDKCVITVQKAFVPATSVTLNKTSASMEVGNSLKLTATIAPANVTYKNIIWTSSDEDVAKVSNGTVTAVASGNAIITAISEDGIARAICNITVTYGTYTLTDGTEYTGKEDNFVKELTYSRIFKTTNWQSLYIPFDMSYEDWKDKFDVAIVNNIHQFDDDDNGTIDRTLIEVVKLKDGKTLKAHTPCVIRAKETSDAPQTITVHNATLRKAEYKSIDCASVSTKYVFYGTYRPMNGAELTAGNYYAMAGGGIRLTEAGDNLKANRWYLDIIDRESETKFANTKISIICFDEDETTDEATGIDTVNNDSEEIIAIFDINGRKQNELTKGINIVKYSNGSTKKITK